MKREIVLLIADDDPGHARVIEKNLRRAGLTNRSNVSAMVRKPLIFSSAAARAGTDKVRRLTCCS